MTSARVAIGLRMAIGGIMIGNIGATGIGGKDVGTATAGKIAATVGADPAQGTM